jgi:hypothetical protein
MSIYLEQCMRNNGRLQQRVLVDGFVWCKLLLLNACNLLIVNVNFGIGRNFCHIDLINCVCDCFNWLVQILIGQKSDWAFMFGLNSSWA